MIRELGNVEYTKSTMFSLSFFGNQGIVYCTCGQCLIDSESRRKFNKPRLDALSIPHYVIKRKGAVMVLDTAKPKNRKSTIELGMRGRDAAGELTLKVNILQVLTIDSSEIQFIVNHNSQSDGQNKSAKSGTNLQKKTIHIVSLQRNREVSYLEQIRQKWAYETSIRFSSRCLNQKSSTPRVGRTS